MTSVYIWPFFRGEDKGEGGIRRVVEGQHASLPGAGIRLAASSDEADVIAYHATFNPTDIARNPRKPLVAHNHGFYWQEYVWENWCYEANKDVMEGIRIADAITAPSEWVAQAIRRHTMRPVTVVPHGVDLAEWPLWTPQSAVTGPCGPDCAEQELDYGGMKVQALVHAPGCHNAADEGARAGGYVLWNKTRPDPVCDPEAVNVLAERMPDVQFRTTYGNPRDNCTVTGKLGFEAGKGEVQRAAVYLATTRETFGVGTLEALAAGVPVVGWRWGAQAEFLTHMEDSYLARPGDYDDLERGVRWALGRYQDHGFRGRCRQTAGLYPWSRAAALYAEVYEGALRQRQIYTSRATGRTVAPRPRVSVIVTAYKLERYLRACLDSVLAQTFTDWECIVVDDASPDGCHAIAQEYAARDGRFVAIRNPQNLYLAGARNVGIGHSRGEYIIPLDADDMLAPGALEVLAGALDTRRDISVAYGGVRFVEEDGATPTMYPRHEHEPGRSGWPVEFDLERLLHYAGQPGPYCSMFRRHVLEQTGGYRMRCRSSEDCDVWLRTASYGYRPALVTDAETLIYRNRADSMSRTEGWQEHRQWYPWTIEDRVAPAGAVFEIQPFVHSCDPPLVSVIIPVGPGHAAHVVDAVDSVDAQSFRRWECIVINDTGQPLPALPSWARIIEPPTGRFGGVAAARNAGIRASRGRYFLPLDADDLLEPRCLEFMLKAAEQTDGKIIYSDFWEDNEERGKFTIYEAPDWDPDKLTGKGALAGVTQLTPRFIFEEVGGYDESLPGWEDWAFQIAYAEKGHCAARLPYPCWTYRKHAGQRRNANVKDFETSKAGIIAKFGEEYWDEVNAQGVVTRNRRQLMACRSCSGGGQAPAPVTFTRDNPPEGAVLVAYTGNQRGQRTYRGPSGTKYSFDFGETRYMLEQDAEHFLRRVDFGRVDETRAAPVPAEPVIQAPEPPAYTVPQPAQEETQAAPVDATAGMSEAGVEADAGARPPAPGAVLGTAGAKPRRQRPSRSKAAVAAREAAKAQEAQAGR